MSFLSLLVYGFYGYLAIGLVTAVVVLTKAMKAIDPSTKGSTVTFKLIILPGVVALWPLIVRRWINS